MHAPTPDRCANCASPLAGSYCASCGQKATPLHLGFHDFAHEALHEFVHVDGKIVQTLRLLVTQPGALTREFLDGRRIRYVSPLRIYLIASAILFAVFFTLGVKSGIVHVSGGRAPRRTPARPLSVLVGSGAGADQELERGAQAAQRDPERLNESLAHTFPKTMFVLMPISALLLWPLYRKQQPYYVPHLYFAIHTHAFAFLAFTVALVLRAPNLLALNIAAGIVVATIIPYLLVALRRVYGGSWGTTIAKGALLLFVYALVSLAVIVRVILLSLRTLH